MSDSWFNEGLDASAEVIKQEVEEQERRRLLPRRFFVTKGGQSTVMFVDDKGFSVHEHKPYVIGHMNREFTCSANAGIPCAGCERNVWKKYVTFFTILDLTTYQGKQGPVFNERRLLAAPPEFAMNVRAWKAQPSAEALKWEQGTLKGRKYTIYRAQTDESSIGASGWQPVPEPPLTREILLGMKDHNGNVVHPTHTVPYDYRTILAPIPYEQQLKKLEGHVSKYKNKKDAAAGSTSGPIATAGLAGGSGPESDVPF